MIGWWFAAAAGAAPCGDVTFDFTGQPGCVRIELESLDAVRLTNACAGPVLVDQRVAPAAGVVAPGGSAVLAGLSAFTLGAEGALYVVTAVPRCEERGRE